MKDLFGQEEVSRDTPSVVGVGRMFDNPKALLVALDGALTDEELWDFHEYIRNWRKEN